ncbi:phosphotransferase [Solicola sp. PLA-1-18]|uniref:phosphotransferase n=1 Tax=Solicola sp. PLA-1-18 TaxID=3380532 RepID=UPI003B7DB99C
MSTPLAPLTSRQRELLDGWLPGLRVVRDHGWGLVESVVAEVEADGRRYVVKADGASNHHVPRELDAHERWLAPWVSRGRAPRLVAGDRDAKILVTDFLPGELVLGSPAQRRLDTFRQAGDLLSMLHAQPGHVDAQHEREEDLKVLRNLDKSHRIPPSVEARLRELVLSWPSEPLSLVPCHGDWQPRNWLVHDGRISAIDFGRAALRPPMSDWLRLHARDFREDPAREAAFVEGYGSDPRESAAWFRQRVREATNTAVWAHLVGDEDFEAEGHAMIDRVLSEDGADPLR